MVAALMAFFSALPALMGGFEAFTKAHYDAKVRIKTAQIGGDVTIGKALVDASIQSSHDSVDRLKVIAGSKTLLFLVVGFATPWIIYEWKAVAWDNVFSPIFLGHDGLTTAIKGDLADWAKTIIACLFGSGTVLTAGSMFFNRKNQ